jgi:hypothetical protein
MISELHIRGRARSQTIDEVDACMECIPLHPPMARANRAADAFG